MEMQSLAKVAFKSNNLLRTLISNESFNSKGAGLFGGVVFEQGSFG